MTEEQARVSPQSNVIMRGLGNTSNHAPEIEEVAFRKGDRFLLCTDGVWGIMPYEELVQRLTSAQDVQSLVGNLSTEVDQRGLMAGGHHDNHTMAMIELQLDSMLKGKMDKLTKIIVGVMGTLLVISLLFNFIQSRHGDDNNVTALQTALEEKNQQLAQLESYQKLYNDVKEKGSKELITRVEVLEYEKASLQEFIDSLMNRIEVLEKRVADVSKPQPTKVVEKAKNSASSAQETAQLIMNRLSNMKEISGKDYAKTLGTKAMYRNEIVVLLGELDRKTSHKYKSVIDGVARELKHPRSEALLVALNKDKTYISTLTASKKIDQLAAKIKEIKKQL